MNGTEDFIDVVHRLAEPHIVTTLLEDGKKHFETHDALIVQLRHAIVPDLGRSANSGSSSEPSVLDVDAVEKLNQVRQAVFRRVTDLPATVPNSAVTIDPLLFERTLLSWRTAFLAYATEEQVHAEKVALERVERMILDKFDPPKRTYLDGVECPICGLSWWLDNHDRHEIIRRPAIVITYRVGDLDRSVANCTYCASNGADDAARASWRGIAGLERLQRETNTVPLLSEAKAVSA